MKFAKNLYDGRTAVHPAPLVPPLLFIFYSIIIISIAFLILLFLNYQFGVLYQKSGKPAVPVHIVSIEYTSLIAAKTTSPDYIICRLCSLGFETENVRHSLHPATMVLMFLAIPGQK